VTAKTFHAVFCLIFVSHVLNPILAESIGRVCIPCRRPRSGCALVPCGQLLVFLPWFDLQQLSSGANSEAAMSLATRTQWFVRYYAWNETKQDSYRVMRRNATCQRLRALGGWSKLLLLLLLLSAARDVAKWRRCHTRHAVEPVPLSGRHSPTTTEPSMTEPSDRTTSTRWL